MCGCRCSSPSEASRGAGRAFVARATARTQDRDSKNDDDVIGPQAKAIIGWCARKHEGEATLRSIGQPALIVHGSDDTMFKAMRNNDVRQVGLSLDLELEAVLLAAAGTSHQMRTWPCRTFAPRTAFGSNLAVGRERMLI